MAVSIPPGGTFFDTLKRSFIDVPVAGDDKISTNEFLEAVEGVLGLFGGFTPAVRTRACGVGNGEADF